MVARIGGVAVPCAARFGEEGIITKVFDWLGKQIDQLIARQPVPSPPAPAAMTDKQLHHAVHDVGAGLLDALAPVIQESFVRYGSAMAMSASRVRR